MKQKWIGMVLLMTLVLAACGANPVDKLKETAAEQIAETIVEQATGSEVEFDADDNSVSYSVDDGEGGQIDIAVSEETDIDAITGMGFTIALPDGLVNGTVQRADDNGEEMMVNATFEMEGVTTEDVYQALHEALTAEGFTYFDPTGSGQTEPNPAQDIIPITSYVHEDGYQFTILSDDSAVILGLIKTGIDSSSDENGVGESDSGETAVMDISTTLDGSINLDNDVYGTGDAIEVTLAINEPLADDAWVGIVPADTPHGLEADSDAVDIMYEYVRNATDGRLTLYAPSGAGNYDVRLFNTDANDGVELAFVTITVSE